MQLLKPIRWWKIWRPIRSMRSLRNLISGNFSAFKRQTSWLMFAEALTVVHHPSNIWFSCLGYWLHHLPIWSVPKNAKKEISEQHWCACVDIEERSRLLQQRRQNGNIYHTHSNLSYSSNYVLFCGTSSSSSWPEQHPMQFSVMFSWCICRSWTTWEWCWILSALVSSCFQVRVQFWGCCLESVDRWFLSRVIWTTSKGDLEYFFLSDHVGA